MDQPPSFVLIAKNLGQSALEPRLVAGPEEDVGEDVIRLEHRVSFEFAAPEARWVLLRKDEIARACSSDFHFSEFGINSAELYSPRDLILVEDLDFRL